MVLYIYIYDPQYFYSISTFNTINHSHVPAGYVLFFFSVYSPVWAGSFCHNGYGEGGSNICSIHHSIYDFIRFLNRSVMFFVFIKVMEYPQQSVFFDLFPPRQETFATLGMGIGNQQGPIVLPPPNRIGYNRISLFIHIMYLLF